MAKVGFAALLACATLLAVSCGSEATAPVPATPDPATVASYLTLADRFEADYAKAAAAFKQRSTDSGDFQATRQLFGDLALVYLNFGNTALDLKWQGSAVDDANALGKAILALGKQLDQQSRWDITQFAEYEKRVEAGNDDITKVLGPVRSGVAALSRDLGLSSPRPVIPASA